VVKALNGKGLADITQGELKISKTWPNRSGPKGSPLSKWKTASGNRPSRSFSTRPRKRRCRNASAWPTATSFSSPPRRGRKPARSWPHPPRVRGPAPEARQAHDPPRRLEFLWVVDFPLMTFDEVEKRYLATHHPFTARWPRTFISSIPRRRKCAAALRRRLNGMELGRRSIRIHQPELQEKGVQGCAQIAPDSLKAVSATCAGLKYGARRCAGIGVWSGLAPHGGAPLRHDEHPDVIAFPKTQKAHAS